MTAIATDLVRNAPRSTEHLLRLLFEGLDWPQPGGMDLEEIPLLDWQPEELHLDPSAIASLSSIHQLPRLTADQPFGVFILEFEGGRLPIGAVRRVVDKLVRKQRARKAQASALWELEDLIFFCQAGDDVDMLHVVSFRDTGKRPVMKVISWSTDATDTRIELVAASNLPALTWPGGTTDADAWRDHWTAAFTAAYRQGIRSAATLATRMADVAAAVRDEVRSLYEVETASGPLRQLYEELKESLRADLTVATFADMYAQTMVYGLLTARISNPEDFSADALDLALTFENSLLDALYSSFRDRGDDAIDVDEFGLRDLAEMLGSLDVDELLADFGDENRRDDPVVYFYQDFLERYDPAQRRELGTYYTPIPVVRFMVHAVDHVLMREWDLSDGVADRTRWGAYADAHGLDVPAGLTPEDPVVRMIDPATGTGTFLLEWLRAGFDRLGKKADDAGRSALMRQMDALEVSLSAYSVAHLKTTLALPPSLRGDARLGIRLADTLAPGEAAQMGLLGEDPIAEEGRRARHTKFETRHSVVIGNPPYLRTSDGGGNDARPLGGMIRFDEAGDPGLIRDFTEPLGALGWGVHAKNLYNLYVYFWRWAMWKACEQQSGPSVVAYITASSYLRGKAFAGMRQAMRQRFDEIWIIDLGGEGRGARRDDNVFDGVMTPVAMCIGCRRPGGGEGRDTPARVRYARVNGTRQEKLNALTVSTLDDFDWAVADTGWSTSFVPTMDTAYADWPPLTDLFPWQHSGAQYKRTWPIAPQRSLLERRWQRLVNLPLAGRGEAFRETRDRKVNKEYTALLRGNGLPAISRCGSSDEPEAVARYAYRSFDRQWCLADGRVGDYLRPHLWHSLSDRQVFMTSLLTGHIGEGPAATASQWVPDLHHFRGSYGAKDVIPLYRDQDMTPNVDPDVMSVIAAAIPQATFERLYAYSYGVLAGADYSTRFMDELETPGPHVPLTTDPELFEMMADLGEHLLWLHTFGERFTGKDRPAGLRLSAEIDWVESVTSIPQSMAECTYDEDRHRLKVGDGVLSGVRPEVWNFSVSGLEVLRKWLAYRTAAGAGRAASSTSVLDDIRDEDWLEELGQELRELVHVLTSTVDYLPAGTELLERICSGPLLLADDLPQPVDHLRKPPSARSRAGRRLDLG